MGPTLRVRHPLRFAKLDRIRVVEAAAVRLRVNGMPLLLVCSIEGHTVLT
jgi:hypothetical protein